MSVKLFTWGLGKSGQLGNGRKETCENPQEIILSKSKCVSLATGGLCTSVVDDDGKVFTFGCGKYGRLGTGLQDDCDRPAQIRALSHVSIKQVSLGFWHGCAVDYDGRVHTWGYNKSHGVLGEETVSAFSAPIQISALLSIKFTGVTCGNNFTLAWSEDGKAFSWGFGQHGVLGQGDQKDRITPTQVAALNDHQVALMDAGFAHCGAVTNSGLLFMFGQGKCGALGLGRSKLNDLTIPTSLEMPEDVTFSELSCSKGEHHGHTLAVTPQGEAFAWGDGYKGKLGLGDQDSRFSPTQIPKENFQGDTILHISSGGIHSSAVSKEGRIFTWGCGSDGRLGHPEAKGHRYLFRSDIPRVIESLEKIGRATNVSATYYHTAAIIDTNK